MPSLRLRPLLCGSSVLVFLLLAAQPLAQAQPAEVRIDETEAIARALGDADFQATSEAARAAAGARADTISLLENPSVSVTRSRLSGAMDEEEEWQAQLVQPIDVSGRRNALRAAAEAQSLAVIAETDRRLEERKAAARRAYAQCAAAEEIAGVHAAFASQLRGALRIVGERVKAGDTAAYDLRRVRVELSAAEAQGGLADGEQAATCLALAEVTGLDGARSARPLKPPALSPHAGATRRLDLEAKERRLEAARHTARAAARARIPELEVGIGYRRVETPFGSSDGPAVSIGATVPLFSSGGAASREAQAQARLAAAEAALARRSVTAEAATARARAAAAMEAAGSAARTDADAGRLSEIAEVAYAAGEIGVAELIDAYRAAHDARTSTLELTERAVLAAIELDLAQGGPIP